MAPDDQDTGMHPDLPCLKCEDPIGRDFRDVFCRDCDQEAS